MLIAAIVLITAALVFYTLGVWTERRHGVLQWRHAALFALGLLFDVSGTAVMGRIAAQNAVAGAAPAGILTQIMQVTGALALVVMAVHLAWAVVVLIRDRAEEKEKFHAFSVGVWALWLVPYFTGMVGSMAS